MKNENRRLTDLCSERKVFKHKNTRMVRGRDRMKVRSMTNLVLMKKVKLKYVCDGKMVRGFGWSISGLSVVL